VQIDHTEVDLFLVDETTRKAMTARPWLTLAIDVFTRMVVGFHLSMDKPFQVSIGLCMLNAVYDKSPWLKENGIEARWPAAGLPEARFTPTMAPISEAGRFRGRAGRRA
jgi:putative transposase